MPKTLLLADDSLTIRRVVELTFAEEDIVVATVGDGGRAIARIASLHPDIVLADAAMPAPNGYDVAAFVKSTPALAHIPVILLTAAFEPIDEARARAAGCEAVLAKPFELTLLVARVKELLRAADAKQAESAPAEHPQDTCRAGVPPAEDETSGAGAPPAEQPQDTCGVGVPPAEQPEDTCRVVVPPAVGEPSGAGPLPAVSLEALFDSIDASTRTPDVFPANGRLPHADGGLRPFVPAWNPTPSGDLTDDAGLSLDDYFDKVDDAIRRSQEGSGDASIETPALLFPARGDRPVDAFLAESGAREAGANGSTRGDRADGAAGGCGLDDVTRIFLSLLETPLVPPSPRLIEEALRRLLEDR